MQALKIFGTLLLGIIPAAHIHIEIDAAAVTLPPGRVSSVDSGAVSVRGVAKKNLPTGTSGIRQLSSAGTSAIYGCFLDTNAAGDADSPPAC